MYHCCCMLHFAMVFSPARQQHVDGILPKGPYPPCLRMADRALLAGYPRIVKLKREALGPISLHWRHNDHDDVSNHQPCGCFLNRLFRSRSKKTSLAFVRGIHRGPVNSPRKWPVTRKMFPFDDVIMSSYDCIMSATKSWNIKYEAISNSPPQTHTGRIVCLLLRFKFFVLAIAIDATLSN